MSSHPEVDMVSFTGSTRAGTAIAAVAAPTAKRVAQELGGKSPNIILPTANIAEAVAAGVTGVMSTPASPATRRPGCWCHRAQQAEALKVAKEVAEAMVVGDPRDEATTHGAAGVEDAVRQGAAPDPGRHRRRRHPGHRRGGPPGRPEPWLVRAPTVFGDVVNAMTISQRGDLRPGAGDPAL
jgi:aldehyde dehydrogenase (NAD+)